MQTDYASVSRGDSLVSLIFHTCSPPTVLRHGQIIEQVHLDGLQFLCEGDASLVAMTIPRKHDTAIASVPPLRHYMVGFTSDNQPVCNWPGASRSTRRCCQCYKLNDLTTGKDKDLHSAMVRQMSLATKDASIDRDVSCL